MRATEIIAENLIREAQLKGEFENLEGMGKPLDLEEYFTIPEEMRMVYTMMRNSDYQSQEVALASRVSRLNQRLLAEKNPAMKQRLTALKAELEGKLKALTEGPPTFP